MLSLFRNDPFFSLFDLHFDDLVHASKTTSRNWKVMDDKYVLKVNTPGYKEDNIKINVTPVGQYQKLDIVGELDETDEHGFHNKSSFKMEEYLANVDVTNISANIKNGVLTVVVPRLEPEKQLSAGQEIKVLPGK